MGQNIRAPCPVKRTFLRNDLSGMGRFLRIGSARSRGRGAPNRRRNAGSLRPHLSWSPRPQARLSERRLDVGGPDQRASLRPFPEALKTLEAGTDLPRRGVYVCPVCGNTAYDPAPDQYPICKAKGSTFIRI